LRTDDSGHSISLVKSQETSTLSEFFHALPSLSTIPQSCSSGFVRWKPPSPEPTIKANYDGALFQYSGEVGVRVIIQNHLGLVLASMSKKMSLPSSVEAVEFLVAVHALQLASDCGFSFVILEGDSEIVDSLLRCEEVSFTSFGHLIVKAKTLAKTFYEIIFAHTHRQCNSIAHNLPRHARHVSGFIVWMEGVPPHLNFVTLANIG